jgi:predicted  nucleic acid-binding Zn-ribbon protein
MATSADEPQTLEPSSNGTADSESVPMVNAGRALNSLRDSGHSIATALAELIDNSIEADANNILLQLDQGEREDGKKHVERVAAIDDGTGMEPDVLHHYLQLGFSTRYMEENTIGKYGVGAKLAALNFALRIDAWSRTSGDDPWLHTSCDLSSVMDQDGRSTETLTLDPPAEDPVPEDLKDKLPEGSGTLIVWSKMDRLEEGRFAEDFNTLRVDIEKQLARIFREFMGSGGINIQVNDTELLPYDPLFEIEGHWGDFKLNQFLNNEEGHHYEPIRFGSKTVEIDDGEATVKVNLCPREAIQEKGEGGNKVANDLRIDGREGYISFVRQDREIAFSKPPQIFPSAVKTKDRYIGIEVSFSPELDDYFGVKNVKRGVEPHGDLRYKIREVLKGLIPEARKRVDTIWDDIADQSMNDENDELDAIEEQLKRVNRVMKKRRVTPDDFLSPSEALEDLAQDVLGEKAADEDEEGASEDEEGADEEDEEKQKEKYKEEKKDLPFVIEPVGWPGDQFINIIHLEDQSIIRLNKRHRFFKELYKPIKKMASEDVDSLTKKQRKRSSRRALEAITLLVVAYAKAESMDESPEERFGQLRSDWGQFLHTMMRKVENVI